MLTFVVRPIVLIASRDGIEHRTRSGRSTMPNPEKTKVALVQMRCGQEPDANLAHALDLIGDAAKNGAQIVCLPELFRSQYFCQSEDHDNFSLAESIPGPSTDALT